MNINLNIPVELVQRLVLAAERIALASERLAGPVIEPAPPRPFPSADWLESSNALSREIELEEAREAEGFGPSYEQELESAVFGSPDSPDMPPRGA